MSLREGAIDIEDQLRIDAQYLKASKRLKERDVQVGQFMRTLNVHRRIAESLVGSYRKAESLKVEAVEGEGLFQVLEENSFGDFSRYLIDPHSESCSCRKKETVGIPCAHLISVMIHLDVTDKLPDQIHPRWLMTDRDHQDFESISIGDSLTDPVLCEVPAKSLTPQQRYSRLNGMCQSIASLGGRSKKMYEIVLNDLNKLLRRLTQPVSADDVIDAIGIRPGRPTTKRIRTESRRKNRKSNDSGENCGPEDRMSCQICDDGEHDTKHCPYRDELKQFISINLLV
jgi:hypothetical protein